MKIRCLAAGAVMALGVSAACATSADAAILVATYTGTVGDGYDPAGLFGEPGGQLGGDTYVVKYIIDTTKGGYFDLLPSFDQVLGGTYFGFSSPVSATVTINGITQSIGGNYVGIAFASPSLPRTYDEADDHFGGDIDTYDQVYISQDDVGSAGINYTLPLTNVYNNGNLQFSAYNTDSYYLYAYADLNSLGTVQITALPELATWAMMLLGVGMIGGGIRMARSRNGMALLVA